MAAAEQRMTETSEAFGADKASVRRIAVVGGGITGLAAAHRIISRDERAEVTVFEASDRLGGIIQTESSDGFLMELGPDSFITNKPGGVQLCEEIGFTKQLIPTDNTFRRSLVLRKGKALPVPDGFMLMAPAKPWAIATTPVLSIAGKFRLLRESFIARRTTDEDESLASFVRRRFGAETLDRLVQPLVGGIYTSDPEKLSLKATLPRFLDMERDFGSVTRATLAEQRPANSTSRAPASAGLLRRRSADDSTRPRRSEGDGSLSRLAAPLPERRRANARPQPGRHGGLVLQRRQGPTQPGLFDDCPRRSATAGPTRCAVSCARS